MVVKESVTEFVTEYAFSFIAFDNLFLVNFQAFERGKRNERERACDGVYF